MTPSGNSAGGDSNSDTGATQDPAQGSSDGGDSGPSTGAVAGIVVGVIAGVLAIAGFLLFFWFRKRKQRQQVDEKFDEPSSSQRGSSAGMISGSRNPDTMVAVDGRGWESDAPDEQRRSRLMAVDPRLDPRSMFMRNKSHESINTIHDDQDYSRRVTKPVLRATNPDPVNQND